MSEKPIPLPELAMKVAAEWAGVTEIFLMSRVVDNPERTGFTALYEMTKRALKAEAERDILRDLRCLDCIGKDSQIRELQAKNAEIVKALDYIKETANRFRVVPADGSEIMGIIYRVADAALKANTVQP